METNEIIVLENVVIEDLNLWGHKGKICINKIWYKLYKENFDDKNNWSVVKFIRQGSKINLKVQGNVIKQLALITTPANISAGTIIKVQNTTPIK
mgnify:FL=1